MHFYKLFELKCVLAVCVHKHPIMIKIHPVFFFLSTKILSLSQIEPSVRVTSHGRRPLPRLLIDSSISAQTALVSYLRPALSELPSVVSQPEQCRQEWLLSDLRCFVVVCNNEIAVVITPVIWAAEKDCVWSWREYQYIYLYIYIYIYIYLYIIYIYIYI